MRSCPEAAVHRARNDRSAIQPARTLRRVNIPQNASPVSFGGMSLDQHWRIPVGNVGTRGHGRGVSRPRVPGCGARPDCPDGPRCTSALDAAPCLCAPRAGPAPAGLRGCPGRRFTTVRPTRLLRVAVACRILARMADEPALGRIRSVCQACIQRGGPCGPRFEDCRRVF